ncbi:MAG: hypothetical protein Q9197_006713, partial [Variospora fuerteventurae]
ASTRELSLLASYLVGELNTEINVALDRECQHRDGREPYSGSTFNGLHTPLQQTVSVTTGYPDTSDLRQDCAIAYCSTLDAASAMASSSGQPDITSTSTSTSTPSFSPLDTTDIDQYINYDPSPTDSAPCSPGFSHTKSTSMPLRTHEFSNDLLLAQPSQQTFAGPSHQYELHKQQTGLPVGALANTFAVSQADHIVQGQAQRRFGTSEGYFGSNTIGDAFDFNTTPYQNPSIDMDIDFASSIYDTNTDYINPNAVGGQESVGNSAPQKQRAWPGMHQQQAAMAKAQAQASQQAQVQAQQQRQPALPAAHRSSQQPAKDPIVEERISRLLNQMRHSSVASTNDDSLAHNASGGNHHLGRAKKDEEDMDEDERLLASEEGKRLSSKERRQLRNKVSARAFRSRRKGRHLHGTLRGTLANRFLEYIGQLEGELAAKCSEADDLRVKNHELMAENTRLTDLTRMLLESPAFSSFLDEMSGVDGKNVASSSNLQQPTTAPKTEGALPQASKDVNPHQPSAYLQIDRSNAQVGMALIPDTYSSDSATAWTDSMDSGLYDAQVYAVTSMPEGPVFDHFDTGLLSGKDLSSLSPFARLDAKQDAPVIDFPPAPCGNAKTLLQITDDSEPIDAEIDGLAPAFSLYNNEITHSRKSVPGEKISPSSVLTEKALECIELTAVDESIEDKQVSVAAMKRFWRFCATMEGLSRQVASVTSHRR